MKDESPSANIKSVTPSNIAEKKVGDKSTASQQPSGFVLKLFHMVNGAPDSVISVRMDTSWNKLHRLFVVLSSAIQSKLRRSN
mmetsp:Transcript_21127/g.47902  ORF Transcript_21127/g.47902 Transcript_21127/m.47902 type:complete len:83 (-) Transcript_21127:2260-2508(-)